jgi:hypothetical protein
MGVGFKLDLTKLVSYFVFAARHAMFTTLPLVLELWPFHCSPGCAKASPKDRCLGLASNR